MKIFECHCQCIGHFPHEIPGEQNFHTTTLKLREETDHQHKFSSDYF